MYINKISVNDKKKFIENIDQIVFSKEFRRLKDKTQLFPADTGDHYRNRLTHTLEVSSISKGIAYKINELAKAELICVELVEAISLGHDLGHTPFGHVGERTLQDILIRKDNLGGLICKSDSKGLFFKHNINSLRILVSKFQNIDWRILDGVTKHTSIFYDGNSKNDINVIILSNEINDKIPDFCSFDQAVTIEGQIVAVADEIAQRCSDLDDTYRSRCFNKIINVFSKISKDGELPEEIKKELSEKNCSYQKVISLYKKFFIDRISELTYDKLVSDDFKEEEINKKNIVNLTNEIYSVEKQKKYKDCNHSSSNISKVNEVIKGVTDIVPNNKELRRADLTSKHIIRQIFKALYKNYKQIGNKQIIIILEDYCSFIGVKDNRKKLKKEIEELTDLNFASKLNNVIYEMTKNKECYYIDNKVLNDTLIDFSFCDSLFDCVKEINEKYIEKTYFVIFANIFLKHIAYFIADMTDGYAIKFYRILYGIDA